MKAFQHLIIKKDANSMQGLLQTLKDVSGKPFEYRKLQSERYADMIFEDRSHVACFKTKRSSLYESTVWMMLRKDELYVTNITSEKNSNLGITNYNFVLNRFFEDKCGWWIDLSVENLVNTLIEAMSLTDEERHKLGQMSRKSIVNRYSAESVAKKTYRLYEWVLGKCGKPDFVYTI